MAYKKLTAAEKRKRLKERRIAAGLEEESKPGRKRLTADPVSLEEMAAMQCTQEEMAAVLGMSVKTFQNRMKDDPEFADAVERGKQRGKVSLRRLQMQHAEGEGGPAVNMTIHLSKHVLGQFDKPVDTHSTVDINVNTNNAGERIAAKLDDLRRRILGAQDGPVALLPVIDGEYAEVANPVAERIDGGVVEHPPAGDSGRVQGEPDKG